MWSAAINRAIAERSRQSGKEALDALAEKLLAKADEGDISALKELGDRLEGKPAQGLELTGTEGGPIESKVVVEYIAARGVPVPPATHS
jgi:hypothetical protein